MRAAKLSEVARRPSCAARFGFPESAWCGSPTVIMTRRSSNWPMKPKGACSCSPDFAALEDHLPRMAVGHRPGATRAFRHRQPGLRSLPRCRRGPGHRLSACRARSLLDKPSWPCGVHRSSGEPSIGRSSLQTSGRAGDTRRPLPHRDRRSVPALISGARKQRRAGQFFQNRRPGVRYHGRASPGVSAIQPEAGDSAFASAPLCRKRQITRIDEIVGRVDPGQRDLDPLENLAPRIVGSATASS